jgi:uncharacterized protein (DUF1501 family)
MRDAADLFHDGWLAIVQGVGYPNPNKSHDVSMAIWQTARFDPSEDRAYGWIGRGLDDGPAPRPNAPASMLIGPEAVPVALRGRKSIAAAMANLNDMALGDASNSKPTASATSTDPLLAFARRSKVDAITTADRLREAARPNRDASTPPDGDLGNRLALIAGLIKSDFGARVYYAVQTGYDTHVYQTNTHERLLRELSQGLRFFLNELKRAKLDDRVVVMTFSEFGRRAALFGRRQNQSGAARHDPQAGQSQRRRPGIDDRLSPGLPGRARKLAAAPRPVGHGWKVCAAQSFLNGRADSWLLMVTRRIAI